jgi:8-oxo-dGTP pyrophosphatase MutT (NUDIX family)
MMSAVEASDRRTDLLEALAAYRPENPQEEAVLARFLAFLDRPDPFLRADPEGHVTASAVVARPAGDGFLLVFHRKLDRWLQPGGHVEPDDASVFAAAVREAREETGVDRLAAPLGDSILDLDVHPIPAFGSEPAHVHYDVRFLLTSEDGGALAAGAAWFSLADVPPADRDRSLDRAVRKAVVRLSAR